jgi:Fe-S-cluster containining protein
MATKELPVLYDCAKCPGYCCSYDYIIVTKRDVARLAKRFNLEYEIAERRFTKMIKGYGRVLRHRKDTIFKSTCQFFHGTDRRCTVYEHRPAVCRLYPDGRRCGYFEFLKWERSHQDDETFIPLAR